MKTHKTMTMPRNALRPVLMAALLSGMLALNGCQSVGVSSLDTSGRVAFNQMLDQMDAKNDVQKAVKVGMTAMRDGDFEAAGAAFQEGLRLDPANSHLHFLNALTYHLRARAGSSKLMDLARVGYVTTLNIDASNVMAAYLLGEIRFGKRDYQGAREMFLQGLAYEPDNPHLLNGLAAASYYAHDGATARKASLKAYKVAPKRPASIRNMLFANASVGRFEDTPRLIGEYESVTRTRAGDNPSFWLDQKLAVTSKRLKDWQAFYVAAAGDIFGTPSSDIVTYSSNGSDDDSDSDDTSTDTSGLGIPGQSSMGGADDTDTDGDDADGTTVGGAAKTTSKIKLPKMTHIDVVIIRTDEVRSQSKGINLLDNLSTTLGGTLAGFKFDKSYGTSATSKTIQTTINPTLTLAGLEYNLNIFNDRVNKAEILARPTLLATEGSSSRFFSGGVLHVQLSSNNSDGSLEDINIGITLDVTPQFLDDETLSIDVKADHAYLEPQDENVGFSAFSQSTETSVHATAVLKFGDTMILSGLSERETENTQSGVPLLQDLPGIQYLFSRREDSETKRSILILLTPRKPRLTNETLSMDQLKDHRDLEVVHSDSLKTVEKVANTNLNAAMAHLGDDSQFYRQFRTGDIELEFFEDDDSFFGAIKRTLGFLYY